MLPNLTSSDLFILVLYLLSVLIIGFSLRSNIKSAKDFLQAGRSLPTWVCTLAFLAASLGSVEVVAMGAAGAQFGPKAIPFFVAGSVPALLFSAIYMIPLYFGSGARTVPEYLGLRFDRKTRLLQAGLFALGTLLMLASPFTSWPGFSRPCASSISFSFLTVGHARASSPFAFCCPPP